MNLLIIEDDEAIRMGLTYYLEQESFNVLEAKNAKIGLDLYDNDIDIILLDINLPDKNGFD